MPGPHRVELPRLDLEDTIAAKNLVALGEHVFVKEDKRWACQKCPRTWVQKPKLPGSRICYGQYGDSKTAAMASVTARTEAKQALENELNARLNANSDTKRHIIVPSGDRWLCSTCNKSVSRAEKARFTRDPCLQLRTGMVRASGTAGRP